VDHSWGYGTDVRGREENQDSHGAFRLPNYTVAIVCDGMGGHVGGGQASALAVHAVLEYLENAGDMAPDQALTAALQHTNQAIYEAARNDHRLMGMGTTIVAAILTEDTAWIAHVGDSRAYLIRAGEVEQVTRDHTMVNLFVDAELLTPEDAATHPEAHVLSRSLGVERQVDVDLAEPIAIQAGDAIFLCSDGIHGVATDWELGQIDWAKPHKGVGSLLEIVRSREGEDNATGVCLLNGATSEHTPPTERPEVANYTPSLNTGTANVIELADDRLSEELLDDQSTDALLQLNAPPVEMLNAPAEELRPPPRQQQEPPEPMPKAKAAPPKTEPPARRRRIRPVTALAAAGAFFVLAVAVSMAMVTQLSKNNQPPPAEEELALEQESGEETTQTAAIAVNIPEQLQKAVVIEEAAPPTDEPSLPPMVFAPEMPAMPNRYPHRAENFTQPPPGGSTQWTAVNTAREGNCPKSLDVTRLGMLVSIDHAVIYTQAWKCFTDHHQLALMEARVEYWEEFEDLIPHFEGSAEEKALRHHAETVSLPYWYRPAAGGIEYRLEAWAKSTSEDMMDDVLADIHGEPQVADEFAKDLFLEAQAAYGLSRVVSDDERVVNWWARRVYVVERALHGRVGRLIEAYRPEVHEEIRQLLWLSTKPRPMADAADDFQAVPAEVLRAKAIALSGEPPPLANEKPKVAGPFRRLEPSLGLEELPPAKVYRQRELVTRSEF
jgi:protein phosphatase